VIRKFNYTNRRRIGREQVTVLLKGQGTASPPSFDATVDLSDMNLPESARVYVEAYYRNSYMRFDFGSVGHPIPQGDRTLSEIDARETIYFRVKVVDPSGEHGKILAELDGIIPNSSDQPGARIAILEVTFEESNTPWRLELTDAAVPVLVVNKRLGGREYVRSDEAFFALVYPAVVREILTWILVIDGRDYDPGSEEWPQQWLDFVCRLPDVGLPPSNEGDPEAKSEWIEKAVDVFCAAQPACNTFLESRSKEETA
jgi:hypothetical protein